MKLFKTAEQSISTLFPLVPSLPLLGKKGLLACSVICGLMILIFYEGGSEFPESHHPENHHTVSAVQQNNVGPGLKPKPQKLFPQDLIQSINQNVSYEASPTEAEQDSRILVEVQPGDNLSILFARAGFGPQNVADIVSSVADDGNLANLYPGDQLAFEVDQKTSIASLEVITSPLESFLYTRNHEGKYLFSHIVTAPQIDPVFKDAVIADSLFQAAQRSGIPAALAMKLADIFGGVVDFMQDTRAGDSFSLLYEEKFLDGASIGFGNILAAQFTNQGKTYTALSYTNAEGETNFFNPEGESMRKAFLLNPVDFTRISSGFNPSRRHPLLNTIRAHRGTDYAAPKGTPVVATADGKIAFANRKGSFGKLVVISHGDNFETRYAHLDAYASGIDSGVNVSQGQVIGYVGSTGSATGPHLHYEFLMDGQHRDSRTIYEYLPRSVSISETEKQSFMQSSRNLIALLANKGLSSNTLAKNTQTSHLK